MKCEGQVREGSARHELMNSRSTPLRSMTRPPLSSRARSRPREYGTELWDLSVRGKCDLIRSEGIQVMAAALLAGVAPLRSVSTGLRPVCRAPVRTAEEGKGERDKQESKEARALPV